MEFWSITVLLGIFGLSFTVFWNIIESKTKALREDTNDLRKYLEKMVDQRIEVTDKLSQRIHELREEVSELPTSNFVYDYYQRKDVSRLEFENLNQAIKNLDQKFDIIISFLNGKVKK